MLRNPMAKGANAERRAKKQLEDAGYVVVRAAGSKGCIDLVAWDGTSLRLVSVKCGGQYASSLEREALEMLIKPANATVEIWRFPTRKAPVIERL